MPLRRRAPILAALISLALSFASTALASCYVGEHENVAVWNERHPGWLEFRKARSKKQYDKAVEIYRGFKIDCDSPYLYHEIYGEVLEGAGNYAEAAILLEKRFVSVQSETDVAERTDLRWQEHEIRRVAALCEKAKIKPELELTQGYLHKMAGRPDLAFAAFAAAQWGNTGNELAKREAKDLLIPAFYYACEHQDWPAASVLSHEFDSRGVSTYGFFDKRLEVAMKADDLGQAMEFLEVNAKVQGEPGNLVPAFRKAARFALEKHLRPSLPVTLAVLRYEAGDPVGGIADLRKISEDASIERNHQAVPVMDSLVSELIASARAKQDQATLAALAPAVARGPVQLGQDEILAVADALLGTGRGRAAVMLLLDGYSRASYMNLETGDYSRDVQGDPEFVKAAARAALRAKMTTTGDTLADLWLAHLKGNSATARAGLTRIATRDESSFEDFGDLRDVAVAGFLAGDIALAGNDARAALKLYHDAAYRFSRLASGGDDQNLDTHFHEALGAIRTAHAQLALDEPRLAERELRSLASVTDPMKGRNVVVRALWRAAEDSIAAALARQRGASAMVDDLESRFERDKMGFTPESMVMREPPAAVLRPLMAASSERREKLRWAAESRERAEKFHEYWKQYSAAQDAPKATEAQSAGGGASSRAFDFQGFLKAAKDASNAQRRCPRCLGSGKINYVTGGKYYKVDSHGMPTKELEDPPPCPECNGTGWK